MPAFVAGNENKAAFTKKQLSYSLPDRIVCGNAGRWGCVPTSGWIAFLVFYVAIIWRLDDPIGFSGLFGFGPKPGCFVVQKRNETPETPETSETLDVVVWIAFL